MYAGGYLDPAVMVKPLAGIGDSRDCAIDNGLYLDSIGVGHAHRHGRGVTAGGGSGLALYGLLGQEADLGSGIHNGAGVVDVKTATQRQHGDAKAEAQVGAGGGDKRGVKGAELRVKRVMLWESMARRLVL